MSDEQQPRAEWIFLERKKDHKGRVWLIAGLSALALVIVGVLIFFVVSWGGGPAPSASGEPSPSVTARPEPSATPSTPESSNPTPEPSMAPITTPPPAPDPDRETFIAQVKPRLDDALRGLDLVANNPDVGAQIVDSLQQDADVLAGTAVPSAIRDAWSGSVSDYATALNDLRASLDSGSDAQGHLEASRASLMSLRDLAGL
jgi:hypothetical protein